MNIFRLAGDMTHLMSIVVLLLKIRATKSCRGELPAQLSGPISAARQHNRSFSSPLPCAQAYP